MEGNTQGQVGIKNTTFRTTWVTGGAAAVTAVGGAVIGLIGTIPEGTSAAVTIAAFALIGVALIAFALVVATDIRARATVDVASVQARANESASSALASSSSGSEDSKRAEDGKVSRHALMTPTGARMGVKMGNQPYAVMAIRVDPETEDTRYLIAQPSSLPRWRGHDELDAALFAFDDHGFPVTD